jgi:multidrug efflux pump subunit AcrB
MKSNFLDKILKKPHFIISLLALSIFLGVYGYKEIDRKLFPDSNRPEIAVVVVWPGAGAKDIATNIAIPVEKELYTIDKIRRVYSTIIDEVAVIKAEFEYEKDIDSAATDAANVISKIRSSLPSDIKEPQIHKITAATAPVITIAVSSKNTSLENVREIAENQIKNELIKIKGVANVDIFGGYKKEILLEIDKKKVESYNLNLNQIVAVLSKNDKNYAIGFMDVPRGRFLLKLEGKKETIDNI